MPGFIMHLRSITKTLVLAVGWCSVLALSAAGLTAADETKPIALAVYDFAVDEVSGASSSDELADMIATVLSINLSDTDAFQVVDRQSMEHMLAEQQLALTGLSDTQQAVAVGRLIGADLIIIGRLMTVGESRLLTTKVVGVETTLMRGAMTRGRLNTSLDEMVFEAADKTTGVVRESGISLLPGATPADPVVELVERLSNRDGLPVFAVVIPEEHISRPNALAATDQPPDPAVETEIKRLLIEAGVELRDTPHNELADWLGAYQRGDVSTWPQTLADVDYIVIGEGLSESGGRLGQLQIAIARAEINVVSRAKGEIVVADRATTRAIDLSENIAAKTALQKAGHALATPILTYISSQLEPAAE
ncbi:MAG: CsgG/HfaB family protein [Planctomycetota bacterium]